MRNEKSQFNNIGISSELDMPRIRHLMKIGLATGVMALIGDILLGYGASDVAVSGIPTTLARYLTVSDRRIFWSAILGLIGIPLECLCYFAVYFLKKMVGYSPDTAYELTAGFMLYFLVPATVLFLVFFLILTVTQIKAFAKGLMPLPKWAWVFSVLFGLPMAVALKIPNLPLTNAFATGWINIGNIWMFCGLLCLTKNMGVVNKQE